MAYLGGTPVCPVIHIEIKISDIKKYKNAKRVHSKGIHVSQSCKGVRLFPSLPYTPSHTLNFDLGLATPLVVNKPCVMPQLCEILSPWKVLLKRVVVNDTDRCSGKSLLRRLMIEQARYDNEIRQDRSLLRWKSLVQKVITMNIVTCNTSVNHNAHC